MGRFLNRLGRFIQSFAVMIMRPDDLIEYSCQTYHSSGVVDSWTQKDLVDSGLIPIEEVLLKNIPLEKGSLLLLGIGGGREAIALAKKGFSVTGVDIVPDMVKIAQENALKHGVEIEGIVQEISKIDVPANFYDIVWFCSTLYSCVPTRKRRVEMLQRIRNTLKPEGYLSCQFHWNSYEEFPSKVEPVRKIFSYLTLGNLWYEKGDILWGNVEFIHSFSSENTLRSEFEEGGFKVIKINIPEEGIRGSAILRNASTSSSVTHDIKK